MHVCRVFQSKKSCCHLSVGLRTSFCHAEKATDRMNGFLLNLALRLFHRNLQKVRNSNLQLPTIGFTNVTDTRKRSMELRGRHYQ
jgi:hypothetical protein